MNKFTGSKKSSALFHEEVDFPCMEELGVTRLNDEVTGLWNWHLEGKSTILNPVPMLRKLTLGKTVGLRLIPSTIYENLSCLKFKNFDDELLLSTGKGGSVLTYSQLPKLEELWVEGCNSLRELLRKEDFNVDAALTFCGQLKIMELNNLPRLRHVPWHLFKGLCSLHLSGLNWEYVFSVEALIRLQNSLQQLEALMISCCENMRAVIQDDVVGGADLVIEFPRLRAIFLSDSSIISFSSTVNATFCLPLLEKQDIQFCKEM